MDLSITISEMAEHPALLVGAPVRNRGWVIKEWLSAVERSCWNAGVEPGFVMAGMEDDESIRAVASHCKANDRLFQIIQVHEDGKHDAPGKRTWNHTRYHYMVDLRNRLLTGVRVYQPGAFLSLDTDILIHPDAVGNLFESLIDFSAVGGKAYMSHVGRKVPSHAFVRGGQAYRTDHEGGVIRTQVIMAIKMMSPDAYSIDYKWHHAGEDFGWSKAVLDSGLTLGWDARVVNKHVMTPDMLTRTDKRCGY